MDRYRQTFTNDDEALKDGDGSFIGVDMRRDAVSIAPGFGAFGRNVRFYASTADSRLGVGLVRWANALATPFPLVFPLVFNLPGGLGEVLGVGLFADPAGTEWLMLATANRVWITRDGYAGPEPLELPAGVTIDGPCEFIQGGTSMYLLRGFDAPILKWTHGYLPTPPWRPAWEVLAEDPDRSDDGTLLIPNAASGLLMNDRFWLPMSRDEFVASDLLSYERYAAANARFRVGNGTRGERLKRLVPYATNTLLACTDRSIYPFLNASGDLADMAQDEALGDVGLAASRSIARVGSDLFFLSQRGVTTIRQAFDNKARSEAQMLSEPIKPLIDRISWRAVENAVGAFWGSCYYLAVPLDGSSQNNAVLVYDVEKKAWCGYDDGTAIVPRHLFTARDCGRDRLLMVDYAGATKVYEEHPDDETLDGWEPVESEFLTRGYLCKDPDEKFFQLAKLDLETWNPRYSIAAEIPGVNV